MFLLAAEVYVPVSLRSVMLIEVIEANCRVKRGGVRRRDTLFSDGLSFMENHNS